MVYKGYKFSQKGSLLESNDGENIYNSVEFHARNYQNLDAAVTSPTKYPQYDMRLIIMVLRLKHCLKGVLNILFAKTQAF